MAWLPKTQSRPQNCFVSNMDKRYGRDTTVITIGKATHELKDKDCPQGPFVKPCFYSDFFRRERTNGGKAAGTQFADAAIVFCDEYRVPGMNPAVFDV